MSRSQAIVDAARKWPQDALAGRYDAAAREHLGPNPAVNFPVSGTGETQATKGKCMRKKKKVVRAVLTLRRG